MLDWLIHYPMYQFWLERSFQITAESDHTTQHCICEKSFRVVLGPSCKALIVAVWAAARARAACHRLRADKARPTAFFVLASIRGTEDFLHGSGIHCFVLDAVFFKILTIWILTQTVVPLFEFYGACTHYVNNHRRAVSLITLLSSPWLISQTLIQQFTPTA